MASKYELTMSAEYAPEWGVTEAVRELFQNAIDNQTKSKGNNMLFSYENGVLKVGNKESVLTPDTILLGRSSKREDDNAIGNHGEGYKIAFMVLLRNQKKVTVYNYGAKEVWETKLVKSKRFNGEVVPQIIIQKQAFWEKVPDHNLTIVIEGITEEEYAEITKSNLHLREYYKLGCTSSGEILMDECEKGNLYVGGLFICNCEYLKYGYNMPPHMVKLDRDRKLMGYIDVLFNTATIWSSIKGSSELIAELILDGINDVKYVYLKSIDNEIGVKVVDKFKEKYGEEYTPVTDNTASMKVSKYTNKSPIMVSECAYNYLKWEMGIDVDINELSAADRLRSLYDSIKGKLSIEEMTEMEDIISMID